MRNNFVKPLQLISESFLSIKILCNIWILKLETRDLKFEKQQLSAIKKIE